MAKTLLISITGSLLPVVAQTLCSEVWVREDPSVAGWPTTDLLMAQPTAVDQAIQYVRGEWIPFKKNPSGLASFFRPGDLVGYIATQTGGTTTGAQREFQRA